MALIIIQQDDTIFLEGALNTETIKHVKTFFEYVKNPFKNFTLNIDNVLDIDASAILELKTMYKKAILDNNMFFVQGNRCEDIYESFQFPQVA